MYTGLPPLWFLRGEFGFPSKSLGSGFIEKNLRVVEKNKIIKNGGIMYSTNFTCNKSYSLKKQIFLNSQCFMFKRIAHLFSGWSRTKLFLLLACVTFWDLYGDKVATLDLNEKHTHISSSCLIFF